MTRFDHIGDASEVHKKPWKVSRWTAGLSLFQNLFNWRCCLTLSDVKVVEDQHIIPKPANFSSKLYGMNVLSTYSSDAHAIDRMIFPHLAGALARVASEWRNRVA